MTLVFLLYFQKNIKQSVVGFSWRSERLKVWKLVFWGEVHERCKEGVIVKGREVIKLGGRLIKWINC